MKKLLLTALIAGSFIGCKKDKPQTNVSIVGKWYDVRDIYSLTANGSTTIVDTTSFNKTANILFNSDGSGVGNDANISQSFNYKVSADSLNLTETISTSPGQPHTTIANVTVKKLSANSLELFFSTGPDIDNGIENHDVTYTR